jgi:hypothetical protein
MIKMLMMFFDELLLSRADRIVVFKGGFDLIDLKNSKE